MNNGATPSPTGAGNAATSGGMPLFYKQPRPLNANSDRELGLRQDSGFGFARDTNSVPVAGVEFDELSRHYPIIFVAGARVFAAAVLGLRQNRNAFVEADGGWAKGCYVPAYVRRYPFVFMNTPGTDSLTLCIDEAAPHVVSGEGERFFSDGKPAALVQTALKFCSEFEGQYRATLEFCQTLKDRELLVTVRADASLPGGETLTLGDFMMVDEARFDALPDEVFLDWRRRNWLRPIYAHLRSKANWKLLAERLAPD